MSLAAGQPDPPSRGPTHEWLRGHRYELVHPVEIVHVRPPVETQEDAEPRDEDSSGTSGS